MRTICELILPTGGDAAMFTRVEIETIEKNKEKTGVESLLCLCYIGLYLYGFCSPEDKQDSYGNTKNSFETTHAP